MLQKIEGRQRMRWLDGITESMDMNLSKFWDSEGQGSLACCSPRGNKELDTTEQAITISLLDKTQINRSIISQHKIKWSEK